MEDTAEVPRALTAQLCSWKERGGLAGVIPVCRSHMRSWSLQFQRFGSESPGCGFKSDGPCCLPALLLVFHVSGRWTRKRWHVPSWGLGDYCFCCSHLAATYSHWHLFQMTSVSSQNDHISLYGKFSCSKYRAVLLVPYGKDRKRFKWGFEMQIRMMGWNKVLVWKQRENLISGFGKLKVKNEMLARIFQAGKKEKSNRRDGRDL